MKKIILCIVLSVFCLNLSACGRTKKLLWWNKATEESPAFIDEKNPLAIPPEYNIKPEISENME